MPIGGFPGVERRGARPDRALCGERGGSRCRLRDGYWTAAVPFGVPILIASTIAFVMNLGLGWSVHSRWCFRGYGLLSHSQVAHSLGVNYWAPL